MQVALNTHRSIALTIILVWAGTVSHAQSNNLVLENSAISVSLSTADGTMTVLDKRTGQRWQQKSVAQGKIASATTGASGMEAVWHDASLDKDIRLQIEMDGDKPEFTVNLSAEADLKRPLRYPHPFLTEAGTHLIIPMNEGISYPVDDTTVETFSLIAYGGHGICMAFWGVTDGQRGHMAILETPDDATIQIARVDGRLCVGPVWDAQKGQFGYSRKLRYIFFDKGGYDMGEFRQPYHVSRLLLARWPNEIFSHLVCHLCISGLNAIDLRAGRSSYPSNDRYCSKWIPGAPNLWQFRHPLLL